MAGICERVAVPAGVELKLAGAKVEVSGQKGALARTFDIRGIALGREGDFVLIESPSSRKQTRAAVGAVKSHLLNMFKGVSEGFTYKLCVVYAHFPISVRVEGRRVLIHNFLGERAPRVAEIAGGAEVEVTDDEILVRGVNKEDVGQTAYNIERATRIKRRDPRTFEDGIYIVERT